MFFFQAEANKNIVSSTTEPRSNTAQAQAKKQAEDLAETRKEQVEIRTDGKRRIQPIFLASIVDDEAPSDP